MEDTQVLFSIREEDIETAEILGKGASGVVFKGIWTSEGRVKDVAVKKMRVQHEQAKEQICKELRLALSMHFEHICKVYGGCLACKGKEIWIVMELMDGGDLQEFLENYHGPLPFSLQLSFCIQAAKAVSSIHSLPSPVLHRDLKSLNFLVRDGTSLLLTDFGLSTASSLLASASFTTGTIKWAAPEVLGTRKPQWTDKADVYSLGMVFYEIVTKMTPYHDDASISSVLRKIRSGIRPKLPADPKELRALIKQCWKQNPAQRPSAKELVASLLKIRACLPVQDPKRVSIKMTPPKHGLSPSPTPPSPLPNTHKGEIINDIPVYRIAVTCTSDEEKQDLISYFLVSPDHPTSTGLTNENFRRLIYVDDTPCIVEIVNIFGMDLFYDRIRYGDGIMMVYSIASQSSFRGATYQWFTAKQLQEDFPDIPIILVGSTEMETARKVSAYQGKAIADEWKARFMEICVKNEENTLEAFVELVRMIRNFKHEERSKQV